jgi:hypothetical protein
VRAVLNTVHDAEAHLADSKQKACTLPVPIPPHRNIACAAHVAAQRRHQSEIVQRQCARPRIGSRRVLNRPRRQSTNCVPFRSGGWLCGSGLAGGGGSGCARRCEAKAARGAGTRQ